MTSMKDDLPDYETLPPTEQLCLEVLGARWRLGEELWTFGTNVKKSLESLTDKGYIHLIHGTIEKTVRARLTPEGVRAVVDDKYVPPLFRQNREIDRLRGWLSWVSVTTDQESGYYALHGYDAPSKEMIEKERDLPENLHPAEIERFQEARQQRIDDYKHLLGSIWLYIPWHYVTKRLTTEQKELFADAVDWSSKDQHDGLEVWTPVATRWWND